MIRRSFGILLLVWASVALMPTSAPAQAPAGAGGLGVPRLLTPNC
jgi:hypothetical protein